MDNRILLLQKSLLNSSPHFIRLLTELLNLIGCQGKIKSKFSKKVCFSRTISMLNVTYMFMVFAASLVVFLFLCYCRYFDETFTAMLWLYLGNSQVSVYRTIGPTLVMSYWQYKSLVLFIATRMIIKGSS